MKLLAAALLLAAACAPPNEEPVGQVRSAVLGGAADSDGAAAFLQTDSIPATYCTARIVAPGLALTARHCILQTDPGAACEADGSPSDITTAPDLTPVAPGAVHVSIGSDRASFHTVGVTKILTPLESSICRSDLAFLVLTEAGVQQHTPLRRTAPSIGETFHVAGWGDTADNDDTLPAKLTALDVPVTIVGPGTIPAGDFATHGNTLCLGDSGAGALIAGVLVGTYSRIVTVGTQCSLVDAQNIFTSFAQEQDFVASAYAAIGETPPWVDDAAPDATAPVVVDAGAPAPAAEAPRVSSSCSMGHGAGGSPLALLALVVLTLRTRKSRRVRESGTRGGDVSR